MANKDMPQGFSPFGPILRVSELVAGGTIYPNDAVIQNSSGQVVAATVSTALRGVAATYATSGQSVMVWDHPDQLFVVQADGTDPDAQTDINLNYNIVATAGNSTYKLSRQEMESANSGTTATLPLKLLAILKAVDNALGANCECVVAINNHVLKGGTGTDGI